MKSGIYGTKNAPITAAIKFLILIAVESEIVVTILYPLFFQ